jgi:CheY-specific phosphatase CheX
MNTKIEMALGEAEVREIVDAITDSFVHSHSAPIPKPPAHEHTDPKNIWAGCVAIHGAFNGAVMLRCSRDFAYLAASEMFSLPQNQLTDENASDALAELANVIGGNIKSLFSYKVDSICSMSLPVISKGSASLPGTDLVQEFWCQCGQQQFAIAIFEERP